MAETRYKLTEKQFQSVIDAQREFAAAREQALKAEQKFKLVSELILDAHGLSPEQTVQLDDATKELVVLPSPEPQPETPAEPPEAPASSSKKKR